MRTLKKSLALVLALVMVLGLGVVGASADNKLDDYTDAADIGDAYYEAVGVLTGLGIIDGMTETTIEPDGTYTREQAAKIIAYMTLGKAAADSLKAVEAPFDDVDAGRWSAGYIAYCVEQGIIDGMTETTFEPTGTLTGFQWAKMLLAAVGYGVNGEFTGESWSLNTARVAHEAGLFDGDLEGADHVALRREQAALYAFNTLTEIAQVTYSSDNTNYLNGIIGYFFADGTGRTLGWDVFGLAVVEGIIVDNEGNGNETTDIAGDYTSAPVGEYDADTSLDMMYHAVRLWFTTDSIRNLDEGTGVFVNDLATVTEYDCLAIPEGEDDFDDIETKANNKEENLTVGTVEGFKPYEYFIIDNSAADLDAADFAEVTYYYALGVLGTRSEKNDTVVVNTTAVDNDDVMTDISEINRRDEIVYLVTEHDAYYVYAVTATAGVVTDLDREKDGTYTITLADDTVLEMSALVSLADVQDDIDNIEYVLAHPSINTPAYSFKLDTHGHYIGLSNTGYQTVAYFTGADRIKNPGDYDVDFDYEAEFVDVETGEIVVVPVTADWYDIHHDEKGEYFDITDELYPDNTAYGPVHVFANGFSYGDYRYYNELVLTTSSKELNDTDVFFDADDVTFIIATGAGTTLDVKEYTGVAALIDAYDYDYSISSIKLTDAVATVVESPAGNDAATVIFAHDAGLVRGGYVFFPEDITAADWSGLSDSYYKFDVVYLNGSDEAEDLKVDKDYVHAFDITAGFYSYVLDANSGWVIRLEKMTDYSVNSSDEFRADADGSKVWLNGHLVPADTPVVDLRPEGNVDDVDSLADFLYNNFNDDAPIELNYFLNADGEVAVIYVVDSKEIHWIVDLDVTPTDDYTATVNAGAWTVVDKYSDRTVEVVVTKNAAFVADTQTVNYTVYYGETGTIAVEDSETFTGVAGTTSLEFDVTVDGPCTIVIDSVVGA